MNILKKDLYELARADAGVMEFIQDVALDGLSYWDIQRPELEWTTTKFWQILGYKPEETPHTLSMWKFLVHPEDLKTFTHRFSEFRQSPLASYDFETRYLHKKGSVVWLRTRGYAVRDETGKAVRILRTYQNITRQKENEAKYDLLFNTIDEGFCIIEMILDEKKKPVDYRFLAINAAFEKQTGMHDAVGKRMREFAPNHEEHWFETYGKIALTGEPVRFENRAEQLHRWYDVYAFRFGDPANLQVGILFNDITVRKEGEERLLALNKELEAFSYSVAHDLRAPLRSILGFAGMLEEDYSASLDAEGKRIVGTIRRNSSRMGQLIDDLLAFSRLGRKEIQFDSVDMDVLVELVLTEMKGAIPSKTQITMEHLPLVRGDQSLLFQVVFNLISNAVKYSSKKDSPEVHIASRQEGEEHIFSVRDNGAGFDMKYADKLFGVFQRLHMERDFEGTGIGLATASRIITRHGGRIWAEAKVEEGACFYFTLNAAML